MVRDPLNDKWLWKLVTGKPHFIIGPPDEPYLIRRYLVPRNKVCNVYLHKFLKSDDDRALHDHPWHWCSIVLKGGYWEHRPDKLISARSWRRPGSVALREPTALHRVELTLEDPFQTEKPCWTLFLTGPKVRDWGFACKRGWVHWEQFTSASSPGEIGRGCGEYE